MDHFTLPHLERLLLEPAGEEVLVGAVQHLWECDRCWAVVVEIVKRHKLDLSSHTSAARSELLSLVRGEGRRAATELRAKGMWAELRELPRSEQLRRIRSVASLRSSTIFDVMIREARSSGPSDPHAGEQTADLAFSLAGLLSVPSQVKEDLRGEALTLKANSRRLLANWAGSFQALNDAESHLNVGTGDPGRAAMLLEIRSLLAMDTGNFEIALGYSRRAMGLHSQLGDWVGVARTAVSEASILLASEQFESAIAKASVALGLIRPEEPQMEVLARGIIIESNVLLGRPDEALHLYKRGSSIFERPWRAGIRLRLGYLEALILDGIGDVRASEKLFRNVAEGFMELDMYKDSFVTWLTLFETQCRRGALDKAAQLCQGAIERTLQLNGAVNAQVARIWAKLLEAIEVGQLQKADLVGARQFFVRYWNIPFKEGFNSLPEVRQAPITATAPAAPLPTPPPVPVPMSPADYEAARAAYDRDLVAAALRETGGNLSEASRRLGMTRMTLRAKIRQYGLMRPE